MFSFTILRSAPSGLLVSHVLMLAMLALGHGPRLCHTHGLILRPLPTRLSPANVPGGMSLGVVPYNDAWLRGTLPKSKVEVSGHAVV